MEIPHLLNLIDHGFALEEAAITESLVGAFRCSVPIGQLIEEIGLAIAIHRRWAGKSRRG